MEQKTHIERNTVQETLVIPLYGRKLCTEQFPRLFRDERAVELIGRIDYDFSALAAKSKSFAHRFGALKRRIISKHTRRRRSSTSAAGWIRPPRTATTVFAAS